MATTPRSNESLAASFPSAQRKASSYRHDPYRGKVFYFDDDDLVMNEAAMTPRSGPTSPPEGTRHPSLWGCVSFVPYPTVEFVAPRVPAASEHDLVRVFIGQLPYFVTDMQLAWLCHTFGGSNAVMYPERIMKRQANGDRLPTGCIHAYATPEAVEALAAGMHKRMLVDDTGVWHARSQAEFETLADYTSYLKGHRGARAPNRPYDTMVVQMATSTYIPRHVAQKPHLAEKAVSAVADVVSRPHMPQRNSTLSTRGGRATASSNYW